MKFHTNLRVCSNIILVKFCNLKLSGFPYRNSQTLIGHPNFRNSTVNTSPFRAFSRPNPWYLDLKFLLAQAQGVVYQAQQTHAHLVSRDPRTTRSKIGVWPRNLVLAP